MLKVAKLFKDDEYTFNSTLLQLALKPRAAVNGAVSGAVGAVGAVGGEVKRNSEKVGSVGRFPMKEMQALLHRFREIFDEKQAKRDGNIKVKLRGTRGVWYIGVYDI